MLQEDYTPLTFAPVISYKLVAGVFRFARGGCFLFSFLLTTEYTEFHGVFLSLLIVIQTNEVGKNLGNTRWSCNVDVHEILRRSAPLDDNDDGEERKYSVRLRVTRW